MAAVQISTVAPPLDCPSLADAAIRLLRRALALGLLGGEERVYRLDPRPRAEDRPGGLDGEDRPRRSCRAPAGPARDESPCRAHGTTRGFARAVAASRAGGAGTAARLRPR